MFKEIESKNWWAKTNFKQANLLPHQSHCQEFAQQLDMRYYSNLYAQKTWTQAECPSTGGLVKEGQFTCTITPPLEGHSGFLCAETEGLQDYYQSTEHAVLYA